MERVLTFKYPYECVEDVRKLKYEAMRKMIYTLNISGKCDAVINKTESGKTLYIEHEGNTYSTLNV